MANAVPMAVQAEQFKASPDYVRISMAAAIELGLKPGRIMRNCSCGCINLLQNYPEGCFANCSYCGLARERPGAAEENTFIRVAWPLYATDLVAEKIASKETKGGVGRVCISQVQDSRAYDDLLDMVRRVHRAAPVVPISALVSATTLDEDRLRRIKAEGVDIIGVGLDAASEKVFENTRGKTTRSPHDWRHHWHIVRAARSIFGAYNVNCHVIIGLGESDRELVELFCQLHSGQIAAYLFSFNPELGTEMQHEARAPIERVRRIQLVKHLIETRELSPDAIVFDDMDGVTGLDVPGMTLEGALESGLPFMTDGCPDRAGNLACNRPYGSYRPGEEYRDYPFPPQAADMVVIRDEIRLEDIRTETEAVVV
ncbi:MAG: radical SAM protein [Anaerolineales bacterium]|nr:radical SAM protein [Anaerolineales bacterium]HJL70478.1 radical SAM protein [Anaerolineales bacterium]